MLRSYRSLLLITRLEKKVSCVLCSARPPAVAVICVTQLLLYVVSDAMYNTTLSVTLISVTLISPESGILDIRILVSSEGRTAQQE